MYNEYFYLHEQLLSRFLLFIFLLNRLMLLLENPESTSGRLLLNVPNLITYIRSNLEDKGNTEESAGKHLSAMQNY